MLCQTGDPPTFACQCHQVAISFPHFILWKKQLLVKDNCQMQLLCHAREKVFNGAIILGITPTAFRLMFVISLPQKSGFLFCSCWFEEGHQPRVFQSVVCLGNSSCCTLLNNNIINFSKVCYPAFVKQFVFKINHVTSSFGICWSM